MKKHFGDIYVVRGNNHTFLGVNIYINENTIQVDMVKQLEECIGMFGALFTSPATISFFEVRKDAKQLSEKKVEFFRFVV